MPLTQTAKESYSSPEQLGLSRDEPRQSLENVTGSPKEHRAVWKEERPKLTFPKEVGAIWNFPSWIDLMLPLACTEIEEGVRLASIHCTDPSMCNETDPSNDAEKSADGFFSCHAFPSSAIVCSISFHRASLAKDGAAASETSVTLNMTLPSDRVFVLPNSDGQQLQAFEWILLLLNRLSLDQDTSCHAIKYPFDSIWQLQQWTRVVDRDGNASSDLT